MIDKVIIAEDHESANLSVQKTMEELGIVQTDYAFYCDDALNKIKAALHNQSPYDLLITDLHFEEDGSLQQISTGLELIKAVRALQPGISILIFSAEQRPASIDLLFTHYAIDGYVRKARHDARELKAAVESLSRQERYYPRALAQLVKQSNAHEFTALDIRIIQLLSQGYQQKDIPAYLRQQHIKPCSLSMIEKRLKQIKEELKLVKNEQLVLYCKEAGIL